MKYTLQIESVISIESFIENILRENIKNSLMFL